MKLVTALAVAGGLTIQGAELPVKNVVLYKHGVGYFERAGELSPGESARLDFKEGDMNDILKSLTVEVKGGAGVSALRYDSSEPLDRKLAQYPLKLGDRQPLSTLLDQLKGARLVLTPSGAQTVEGVIVSARVSKSSDQLPEQELLVLLTDSGELRTFNLSAASALRLADPKLQLQLKEYLSTLTQARANDKRSVYIDSTDSGRRQIAASYMIPTPIWKSSYRLIFPAKGEALLEGWAIVDNTTGEDWTNIRLALVSGRPISFISQLYEPRYVDRPVAELPEERAKGPVVHSSAMGGGVIGGIIGGVPGRTPASPPPPQAARMRLAPGSAGNMAMADEVRERAESTVAQTAQGRDLGELFEYRFSTPVTVRKNESAMLPFLQQKLSSRKLLIYSDSSSQHPFNAAELTNSSGKTLDGGPITVYDAGTYAGEALFETVKTGDKRLISYGIDIGTRITTKFDSSAGILTEASYRRGVLTTRSAIKETKTFTIRNVDAKEKTLIIEHPVRTGYKLLNQKPTETTANALRFEVKLTPSASQAFTVEEERLLSQSYSAMNLTPDFIATLVSATGIPAPARRGLRQVLDKKGEIAQVDGELARAEVEVRQAVEDQNRIRENMSALSRVAGQQEQTQKYANQLAVHEGQLAKLRDRQVQLRRKKATLEAELNAMEF